MYRLGSFESILACAKPRSKSQLWGPLTEGRSYPARERKRRRVPNRQEVRVCNAAKENGRAPQKASVQSTIPSSLKTTSNLEDGSSSTIRTRFTLSSLDCTWSEIAITMLENLLACSQ